MQLKVDIFNIENFTTWNAYLMNILFIIFYQSIKYVINVVYIKFLYIIV